MTDNYFIQTDERLTKIEARLTKLESHNDNISKLSKIEARRIKEDLERGPPEHKAAVEKEVQKMLRELNE